MPEVLTSERAPIAADAAGVLRIAGSRVTLDSVVAAFGEGATAEEIAQQYPSISLADVYQAIGYYLRHSTKLEAYFARRRQQAAKVRADNEARWPPEGIRARLLARRGE